LSSPEGPERLDAFHWAFDKLYPAIRFTYERLLRYAWFSQVTPLLWIGGAPTYRRDYEALLANGITAVIDIRAERGADLGFYDAHGISHHRLHVPDIGVPSEDILTDAVGWIEAQLADGRVVLVHCAKGRGRSATVLAAYLMRDEGMPFVEASELLQSRRPLVKLEARHRQVLESWIAAQAVAGG
jgi:Dual specificity phosphatase, catalytic domain